MDGPIPNGRGPWRGGALSFLFLPRCQHSPQQARIHERGLAPLLPGRGFDSVSPGIAPGEKNSVDAANSQKFAGGFDARALKRAGTGGKAKSMRRACKLSKRGLRKSHPYRGKKKTCGPYAPPCRGLCCSFFCLGLLQLPHAGAVWAPLRFPPCPPATKGTALAHAKPASEWDERPSHLLLQTGESGVACRGVEAIFPCSQ